MDNSAVLAAMHSKPYRAWLLTILLLMYMFALLDRSIIMVLAQPIKIDLGLTDTEIGLLSGLAFAVLHCSVSLPIARIAERASRVRIYGIGIMLWSVATIVCGFATNFVTLFLSRCAVGIGEATQPASTSLLADYYPPEKRVAASAILVLGIPVGGLIGLSAGGIIAQEWGWRWVMYMFGVPGFLLGMLFMLTIKEPIRGHYDPPVAGGDSVPPLSAFLCRAVQRRTYMHVLIGSTISTAGTAGIATFIAAYMFRRFDMNFAESGMIIALIVSLPSAVSIFFGGMLTSRLAKADKRNYLIVPGIGLMLAGPLYILSFMQTNWILMAILLMLAILTQWVHMPVSHGIFANTMEPRMRATSGAVEQIARSVLGSGLGPLFAGIVSDYYARKSFGANFDAVCGANLTSPVCNEVSADALTAAMSIISLFFVWSAFHYFWAARTVERDMS